MLRPGSPWTWTLSDDPPVVNAAAPMRNGGGSREAATGAGFRQIGGAGNALAACLRVRRRCRETARNPCFAPRPCATRRPASPPHLIARYARDWLPLRRSRSMQRTNDTAGGHPALATLGSPSPRAGEISSGGPRGRAEGRRRRAPRRCATSLTPTPAAGLHRRNCAARGDRRVVHRLACGAGRTSSGAPSRRGPAGSPSASLWADSRGISGKALVPDTSAAARHRR